MPENDIKVPEKLTPELIRKVADEVYRMLSEEARIEYDRSRGRGARPTYKRRVR